MIAALALLGYAALLLTAGAAALARARWTDRTPRLAVAAWLALSGSAVTSVILGGAAVLLVSHALDHVLRFCPTAVWVDRGRIVKRGPSLEVVRAYDQFTRRLEERE